MSVKFRKSESQVGAGSGTMFDVLIDGEYRGDNLLVTKVQEQGPFGAIEIFVGSAPHEEDVRGFSQDDVLGLVAADFEKAREVEEEACEICHGSGYVDDSGPHEGCSEFAPVTYCSCEAGVRECGMEAPEGMYWVDTMPADPLGMFELTSR